MNETLVDEILKRVLEAVNRYEADTMAEGAGKEKILLLGEGEDAHFYESLVKAGVLGQYDIDCALTQNYDVNLSEYKAVVLNQLSNQVLGKLSSGIFDSPFLSLTSQVILTGKSLYVPEDGVELFRYRDSAPKAFYKMLEDRLNLLLESGVVIAKEQQLLSLLQKESQTEEKRSEKKRAEEKQKSVLSEQGGSKEFETEYQVIDKRIITEKDLINLYVQRVNKISIPSNSILSDLAKEYARDKKIEIQRIGTDSGTARRAR